MANTYVRVADGGLAPRSDEARSLGAQFRRLRTLHGVTLAELRQRTGFAVNTIRAHESGAMPLRADDLLLCAQAMGVRPGTLLHRREEEASNDPNT